ncbi:MAG: gamma-glutamyltransferase [Nannocystaceae bacterium]
MQARAKGCIAAGHPVTAGAGAEILAAGGNAFDAALAALCAACVAEPVLASLGGGGFCLAHDRRAGRTLLHDFFVHTPLRRCELSGIDFPKIVADFGVATQDFHIGMGSVATPGLVRGIFAIHRAHGSLPMREIVAPAVRAAREGVILTPFQAWILQTIGAIYRHTPGARALFTDGSGALLQAGARIENPGLADLLDALAREGEALFYDGEVAAAIEAESRTRGGHLTRDDLHQYRVIAREPLHVRYRGATLITNPPPSSGGLLIAFGLRLLEALGPFEDPPRSVGAAARIAAVLAATQAARGRHGATPALLDPELVAAESARIAEELAAIAAAPTCTRGTTHISVIDAAGDAAAITVSNGEGCGYLIPGTGTMLNNMLGEEDINPGGFHRWAPGARMASMMAPTAILGDPPAGGGEGWMAVLGSGGSKRIRTAILQVLVGLLDHGLSLEEAVASPRIHLDGEHLNVEAGQSEAALELLAGLYPRHSLWPEPNMYFGGVHAVAREADGRLHGVGDPRRAGVCLGA